MLAIRHPFHPLVNSLLSPLSDPFQHHQWSSRLLLASLIALSCASKHTKVCALLLCVPLFVSSPAAQDISHSLLSMNVLRLHQGSFHLCLPLQPRLHSRKVRIQSPPTVRFLKSSRSTLPADPKAPHLSRHFYSTPRDYLTTASSTYFPLCDPCPCRLCSFRAFDSFCLALNINSDPVVHQTTSRDTNTPNIPSKVPVST